MAMWQQTFPGRSFEELVAMYINDCLQYLECERGIPLSETRFPPTQDQDALFDGLRELKDACMLAAGLEPLQR